ncbi:MAG: hypothetical protein ACMUJM_23315 [bacterium]
MSNTLALKPYIEKIRKHCNNLSKADLTDLLCLIAQEVPVKERHLFLEKLKIISIDSPESSFEINEVDEILSRVNGVIEDILERQESIEDGSYYEENYEYGDYYDDESPDGISEEQKEDIEALFLEADQLFLAGNSDAAKKVYRELIGLFGHNSQRELCYEIYHNDIDINWRETLARYCRCVYETSFSNEKVVRMLSVMEVEQPVFENHYDKSRELLPSLRDIFDAKTGELDRWHDFLEDFRKELKQKNGNRAFLLYLETINWLDGLKEVASEIRKKKIPVGYLYWLDQLQANGSWHELAEVSQEALANMPLDNLRAYAAGKLSLAGENTKDTSLVLQGKREQFFSASKEQNLVSLLKVSVKQDVKEAELKKVLDFLKLEKEESSWMKNDSFILKIKVLLMLGNLKEAYSQIDKETVVGWSYSKQTTGGIYASILITLTKGNSEAKSIHNLFNSYIGNKYTSENFIRDEILKSLSKLTITKSQKEEWFQFIQKIATSRVDHIVSNKHRKAYARAAETMGGYMECLILNEQKNKAIDFLNLNRNQKYSRFPAFRSEVDRVLKSSPLLFHL